MDDDGLVLSSSAAIVPCLAHKCGRLIPAHRAGEAQVLRWCNGAAAARPDMQDTSAPQAKGGRLGRTARVKPR